MSTDKERISAEYKLRCHECGKRKPESETTMISALVGGDYRRAARRGTIRVCRDCTISRVAFVRDQQAKRLNTMLNSGRTYWEQAARYFELDISGLLLDRGRRAP